MDVHCDTTVSITIEYDAISVAGISIDIGIPDSLGINGTYDINVTVSPSDATNKTLIWSTSDPSIAIVDSNGVVTAIKGGSVTITVTTNDGSKTASQELTISAAYNYASGATGITQADVEKVAWVSENSEDNTHNIGTRVPKSLGIYDMSGNVWEY